MTYWYGAPAPALVKTDELKIGDPASERAHQYVSPQASAPYELTSRYEWGVDSIAPGMAFIGSAQETNRPAARIEVFPAHTDQGRKTGGTSEFTLRLDPKNLGALLRRKLDYAFPNQRAEVYIADANQAEKSGWQLAGIWYLAGANTCVYSNPREELGVTQHIVQTSNRRFRDDEFLVPRALTEGRSAIRVRVKFIPVTRPLFPGHPLDELAWSEFRYDAYCFVPPNWDPRSGTPGTTK